MSDRLFIGRGADGSEPWVSTSLTGPPGNPFELTEGERHHPLWLGLRKHFADQLAAARLRNDDPALDQHATAALRGRIAALKSIIALGDDRPVIGE